MIYCSLHGRAWVPRVGQSGGYAVSHPALAPHWEAFPLWSYQYAAAFARAFHCLSALSFEEHHCDVCTALTFFFP